ncbi:MAG: hypothetical protein ACTSWA_05535 [Candidatus Thorarchaeota archaeon]
MQLRIRPTIFAIIISLLIIGTPLVSGQSLELIEWHDSVKKDAIFAWKMTTVDFVDNESAGFLSNLLIQMKFTANPPSDPSRIFNATQTPDWVNMYINGFKIDLEQMGEMGAAFTQLISPTVYHFDNGTSLTLDEMQLSASPVDGPDTYYTVDNGYINATVGNETMRFTTFTNIETGIAKNISIYMEEMGSLILEYYPQAANVDDEGKETTIEDEYTDFQDPLAIFRNIIIVSATIIGSVILVIVVFVVRRRRS